MVKKLLPLFLSQSLRSVAVSLLSFFSVVFIYKHGLEAFDNQKQALVLTFGAFLFLYFFKIIGTSLAENLSLKWGLKVSILLGHLLTGLALFLFSSVSRDLSFIWWAMLIWGLAIGFFWYGRHSFVVKIGDPFSFGKTLGFGLIVDTVLLMGAPFLGGLLISRFGYSAMFMTALLFVFMAILALIPLKNEKTHQDVTLAEEAELIFTHKKTALAYFSSGFIGAVYAEVLVLYIFLTIQKELGFGLFFTLSMILVAVINYLICQALDKNTKNKFVARGAILSSLVWVGRFLTGMPIILFILDVVDRVSGGLVGYPLEVLSFQKALDGRSTGRAILFREVCITLGEFGGIFLALLIVAFGVSLHWVFLLVIPVGLLRMLIVKKDGLYGEK